VTGQRGPFSRTSEARFRSGSKPSRTKRRVDFKRRSLRPGEQDETTERRFGILLQTHVARQLKRLNVPHRLIDYRDDYARSDRVELAMLDDDDGKTIAEIQYTLRRGIRGKIESFIRAATVRANREVPRIYIEIEDRVGYALKPMADRVAHAIRDIVIDLAEVMKRREQGNVIGLALILNRGKHQEILSMRLMRVIGTKARAMLESLLAPPPAPVPPEMKKPITTTNETAPERPVVAKPPRLTAPPRLLGHIENFFLGFIPNPNLAFAAQRMSHPLRMPFRR